MINRTRKLFYEVGGTFYPSLIEAQKADLVAIIPSEWSNVGGITPGWLATNPRGNRRGGRLARLLVANKQLF